MESRNVKQLLQSAATGSFLLLSAAPLAAGHIFPDEPQRPHMTAGCLPNWGYNQTCWQRFPPVPPCDSASDCNNNFRPALPDSEQPGSIYTPPSGLLLPNQNLYQQPGSILPPSAGGSRYALPAQPDPHSKGSELFLPSSPVPSTYGGSLPPYQLMPQDPAAVVPGSSFNTPPVPKLHPTPLPPSALPPLPSPPAGLSQPQGQTRFTPDRLMFTPDGRIVAGPAATSNSPATSSRYGGRQQVPPVLMHGEQSNPSRETLHQTGTPYHFASTQDLTVPAHAVSQGRSPINSAPSNRYGAPRR
jgi:hypothetical protein